MASAHVQSNKQIEFSSATAAVTLAGVAAGSTLYAVAVWPSLTETLTSISSSVDGAFTLHNNPTANGDGRMAHGYLMNATAGSHTVTATKSGAAVSIELFVFELSDAGTMVDKIINPQTTPGTGADAVTSTAITTAANGILVGVGADLGQITPPTVGTGFTAGPAGTIGNGEYKTTSGVGPTAVTFTETESYANDLTSAMAFSPAGGGPPPDPPSPVVVGRQMKGMIYV